jgi:hypothetical protein
MDRETQKKGGGAVPCRFGGDFFMAGIFFAVPGAGGTGYAQPAALRLRAGKTPQQIPGMGMGIVGHGNLLFSC